MDKLLHWVQSQPAIRAVALVGSHARGTARPDSDVDLVLLTPTPDKFRHDTGWMMAIGTVARWEDADYGAVWSRHVHFANGLEVEFSFGALSWAAVDPVDDGTRHVMTDGHVILYDPDGLLKRLIEYL